MNDQQLPPPPASFFQAIKEARRQNLLVKCSRRAIPGQARYVITEAGGSTPLFTADDIGEIRQWLKACR